MAEGTCSVEGCDRRIRSGGMCAKHYLDWYKANGPECVVAGCPNVRLAKDMCRLHYGRWKRHGDPLFVLRKGQTVLDRVCTIDGCEREFFAKGMCELHYDRVRYAADPERSRARRRASNARPDVRARAIEREHAKRAAAPEIVRERNRASYARHAERRRADRRAYAAANPDLVKAGTARRRARKRGAPVNDLTAAQWREIKAIYKHHCAYCHTRPKRLTMDHVIPLSRGGSHTASNVVPACAPCNFRKHAGPAPTYQPPLM